MISVVITTLNSATTLPRCFGCLMQAAIEGLVREVIVVDGGSTDQTARIADEVGAEFIHADGDTGMRRRAGAAKARHGFLLFLNADMALGAGWEEEAERFLASSLSQNRVGIFPRASRWLDWTRPLDEKPLLVARGVFARGVKRSVRLSVCARSALA